VRGDKGKAAYVHKQSAMYHQLALNCKEAFKNVNPRVESSQTEQLWNQLELVPIGLDYHSTRHLTINWIALVGIGI